MSAEWGSYNIVYREDINGIGLSEYNTILAGKNVKESDIEALITISEMTASGKAEAEILEYISCYVTKMNKDTVIKNGKLLEYYTAFDDITERLVEHMVRQEYAYATFYLGDGKVLKFAESYSWIFHLREFKDNVRNSGKWDLKQLGEWNNSSLYYFDGEIVDADAPGNIMYGYMGCAYGIPQKVLYVAAGFAQIRAGTSSKKWITTYGDDPMDSKNITRGIEFYKRFH